MTTPKMAEPSTSQSSSEVDAPNDKEINVTPIKTTLITADSIEEITSGLYSSNPSEKMMIFILSLTTFNIYLQSNYTGPEFKQMEVLITLSQICKINVEGLVDFDYADISSKLSVDGEMCTPVCKNSLFLLLSLGMCSYLIKDEGECKEEQSMKYVSVLVSRLTIKHFQVLQLDGQPAPPFVIPLWKKGRESIIESLANLEVLSTVDGIGNGDENENLNSFLPNNGKDKDQLSDSLLKQHIKKIVKSNNILPNKILATIILEIGLLCCTFKQLTDGKCFFDLACKVSGLTYELTGRVGKKTKFQEKNIAQMVVLASSFEFPEDKNKTIDNDNNNSNNNNNNNDNNNNKIEEVLPPAPPSDTTTQMKLSDEEFDKMSQTIMGDLEGTANSKPNRDLSKVHSIVHEVDNPLKELTEFEDMSVNEQTPISVLDQSILLAMCLDVKNENPMDGLLAEEMGPFLERVLSQQHAMHDKKGKTDKYDSSLADWMVYSTTLLERAWLECESNHKRERSILQIQALVDQHETRLTPMQSTYKAAMGEDSSSVEERIKYLHTIVYPPRWLMKKDLAERYAKMGVVTSAAEMFAELHLWDETVECYKHAGKKNEAIKIVHKRLDALPDGPGAPRMWAALGDLTDEEEHYSKAWELSNGKYARAKAALGRKSYDRGEFRAAVEHLTAAVAVKPLTPSAWFLLGNACMRSDLWVEALNAFTHVVQQEPEEGDAWANIAAIHMHNKNSGSAYPALNESLKYNRNNWRVWVNKLYICMDLMKYDEAIQVQMQLLDFKTEKNTMKEIPDVDEKVIKALVGCSVTKYQEAIKEMTEMTASGNYTSESMEMLTIIATVDSSKRTIQRVGELLGRISSVIKTEAWVWQIYAVYNQTLNRGDERIIDCLQKCQRALTVKNYENDVDKLNKVCDVTIRICNLFMKEQDDEQKKTMNLNNARYALKAIAKKINAQYEFNMDDIPEKAKELFSLQEKVEAML